MHLLKTKRALCVLLPSLILFSAFSSAAPKTRSAKSQNTSASNTRVKWEYCYVVAGVSFSNGQGVAAYLPQGQRLFMSSSTDGFKIIAQMLNRLGEQGWQVVSYQSSEGAGQSWTLTRRK